MKVWGWMLIWIYFNFQSIYSIYKLPDFNKKLFTIFFPYITWIMQYRFEPFSIFFKCR